MLHDKTGRLYLAAAFKKKNSRETKGCLWLNRHGYIVIFLGIVENGVRKVTILRCMT